MIHFLIQTPSSWPLTLLLLISISGFILPCCSQRYLSCSGANTGHPNLNSNINFLLDSLISHASSRTFYTETSNGIHGLFLCRGDVPNETCRTCIEGASQQIKVDCASQTNGTIGFDECMLRFSVVNFFGILEMSPRILLYNSLNQSTFEDRDFVDLALVSNLVRDAKNANSMFKEGEVNIVGVDQRFGLAQCTRDIGKRDCEICLTNLVDYAKGCCLRQRGWRVLAPNCNLRVEAFRFYGIPTPSLPLDEEGGSRTRIIVITVSTVAATAVLLGLLLGSFLWRKKRREMDRSDEFPLRNGSDQQPVYSLRQHFDETNHDNDGDMHYFNFSTLKAATNNFSDVNKLGEGGFGPVYKGKLMGGEEVAVKRLSTKSSQGHEEFKNEAKVIWKLQHKNLVRLLGCCVEGGEKLLVYEYMANTSLDAFLFDPLKCKQLDFLKRENIVNGIARGILYLHEDSRLKIIHRDLKASNVLLDDEMNPKISDFGTARIFGGKQIDASTNRIVGTYGYMAPEYAMEGVFSVKSDVYSFGVLMLEVMSGKKNIGFLNMDRAQNLLSYAWELWSEGRAEEMIDKNLSGECPESEAVKWIHIGLLCVQEDPNIRPTMSMVVLMLGSKSIQLPQPSKPPFLTSRGSLSRYQSSTTETGTGLHTTDQSSTSASI
ncbi:hypothetical protein Csa_003698 [Cucumis sativus]|nr:hypothetical protein Csa_003698 [Cucumis sativus]